MMSLLKILKPLLWRNFAVSTPYPLINSKRSWNSLTVSTACDDILSVKLLRKKEV